MKILAIIACTLMALMMFAPLTRPVKATATMPTLQYLYFDTQDAVFAALQLPDGAGGIDTMQWPLTHAEYTSILSNTNIIVEPLTEAGEFEIAFNNNYTDNVVHGPRSPMNYTDFRNALNCLVDVGGVIAGPTLGGFATRSYTQVPTPVMSTYVNNAVTGAGYPWAFNVTHALQILWTNGWYNHAVYPTLKNLLDVYAAGGLAGNLTSGGSVGNGNTLVYSGSDSNPWDGGNATANAGIANTPIHFLQGYVRSGDARKDLGDYFVAQLNATGIPYIETYKATLTAIRPYVFFAQTYDFATLGYSFGVPPNWWYSELTPAGIYSNGPNPYLVDDANTTHYAAAAFTDPTPATFQADQLVVQYNLVWESYLVAGYCPATYCAYKTGSLGQIDIIGQGTEANGAQWENWLTLDARKSPSSSTFYLGLYNPPDMVNPIFQDTVFDFQVSDEIFTYPIGANPYTIALGSSITGNPAGGDLPWMAYSWKTELVGNPGGVDGAAYPGQWTNVTLWFRHDITWHDGVPFTVSDINYTVYINALYGDSYTNSGFVFCVNNTGGTFAPYFQQDGNPYTCSILVKSASWLNLYLPLYQIVPEHLYKYIVPQNMTAAELGLDTTSLHGLWPGQAAVSGDLLAGAPFTLTDLNTKPETTLVGTGPFQYRVGSIGPVPFFVGGGITLDAYPSFFLTPAPGAIALKYTWLDTVPADQPSGGYFKVGLADLVYLANAYGTTGTPAGSVPITEVPGAPHSWNPGADLAPPSGVVGLSDLVTLALHYGWYFGPYGYNPPYPASQIASGILPSIIIQANQTTYVNITAGVSVADNSLNVAVYQNGAYIGMTPLYMITINTTTTFSFVQFSGFKAVQKIFDPSGIGIHVIYN